MPEIPELTVGEIGAPRIIAPYVIPSPSLPTAPPVTSATWPVIDMPGCVRARINSGSGTDAFTTDPKGNVTLCQGNVPTFEALDYRPREFTWVQPPAAPIKKPEVMTPPVQPTLPQTPGSTVPDTTNVAREQPCPPFGADPLGSWNKIGTKVLAGYELVDGECVKIWDPAPIGQVIGNYIPDAGPTVSVALTAALATTVAIFSKPLASILQKLAKPVTKKVVKKLLLKKEKPVSVRERILAQRDRSRALMALRRMTGK